MTMRDRMACKDLAILGPPPSDQEMPGIGARPPDSAPEYIRSRQHRKAPKTASEFAIFPLSHPYDTLVSGDGDFSAALVFCQMFENGGDAVHQHMDATFIWVETVRLVELRILGDTL